MATTGGTKRMNRRSFLLGGTGLVIVQGCDFRPTAPDPDGQDVRLQTSSPRSDGPLSPIMSALHVHASFSEGWGSMEAHLAEAQRLGVQVIWWTEHDWRMAGLGYLDTIPVGEDGDGVTWTLKERQGVGAGRHTLGVDPRSHASTPDGGPALHIMAEAPPSGPAEHALSAQSDEQLFTTSLQGQTWSLWVQPEQLEQGVLELRLRTSQRPATNSREAGDYHLCYRFGVTVSTAIHVADRVARIPVVSPAGEWTRVTLRPVDDLAAAWPDIDGRDAGCTEVTVVARARPGGAVSGLMGAVTIDRLGLVDDGPLETQQELMARYADSMPGIRQLQGVEVSGRSPHVCWYGGAPRLPRTAEPAGTSTVEEIHASGGVASYAHPFGVAGSDPDPETQEELVATTLEQLLPGRLLGCDALEVGYRRRGGATLATHEALWDACSRRGVFLTGLGVNDNHSGMNWDKGPNNFVSWLWSPSLEAEDLLRALRSGHVYFGDPTLFAGRLDLRTSSGGHMGSVDSSTGSTTQVELLAAGLTPGARVELVQHTLSTEYVPVDEATTTIFSPEQFVKGHRTTYVPTESDCFIRTRVRDGEGAVIALSNPLWLVADVHAFTVPPSRLPGSGPAGSMP